MFVKVDNVFKNYGKQEILKEMSFEIAEGECLGLVGESGSGKSTLSRLILGLENPNMGDISIEGIPVKKWAKKNIGKMSVVFQDYTSSTNPNFTVGDIIKEPMLVAGKTADIDQKISQLLKKVGLNDSLMKRFPHELSGGQLQRVCIARAISTNPKFIVLDEAISSLDVSIQAQILDLLVELQKDMNITYLFITHDLQTVTSICDNVVFLYNGESVEKIDNRNLFKTKNSYAKKLLNSIIPFEEPVSSLA